MYVSIHVCVYTCEHGVSYKLTYDIIMVPPELLGTPGYLAPEMLKRNVEAGAPGYAHPVDM